MPEILLKRTQYLPSPSRPSLPFPSKPYKSKSRRRAVISPHAPHLPHRLFKWCVSFSLMHPHHHRIICYLAAISAEPITKPPWSWPNFKASMAPTVRMPTPGFTSACFGVTDACRIAWRLRKLFPGPLKSGDRLTITPWPIRILSTISRLEMFVRFVDRAQ